MDLPVTITENALSQIRTIMAGKNIPPEYALRIGVKGGGCAGLGFLLGFDKPKTGDDIYSYKNLQILIEKKHTMYLLGLQVDYQNGDEATGFLFTNPDAEQPAKL